MFFVVEKQAKDADESAFLKDDDVPLSQPALDDSSTATTSEFSPPEREKGQRVQL